MLWKDPCNYLPTVLCRDYHSTPFLARTSPAGLRLAPTGYEHSCSNLHLFIHSQVGHELKHMKNKQPCYASAQGWLHFNITWGAFTVTHFGTLTPQKFQFSLSRVGHRYSFIGSLGDLYCAQDWKLFVGLSVHLSGLAHKKFPLWIYDPMAADLPTFTRAVGPSTACFSEFCYLSKLGLGLANPRTLSGTSDLDLVWLVVLCCCMGPRATPPRTDDYYRVGLTV